MCRLEIAGISAIDLENHIAHHLETVQTFTNNNDATLVDWYVDIITTRKEKMCDISNIIVADSWLFK